MEEKELFEDYEMRTWEFTPRIYKIFGIAALANLLILFALGQFNLFTTRGCDTPYVGMVCQVLDSAYVASVFMGKGFESESVAYDKTELEDADITYIDVSDKLEYPAGYFALANPEQMAENPSNTDLALNQPLPNSNNSLTPLPGSTDNGLMNNPQVTPTPNKSIDDQEFPTSPFDTGSSKQPSYKPSRITPTKTPKPSKTPSILSNDSPSSLGGPIAKATPKPTPKPQPTPSATPSADDQKAEFVQKFNKKPLQDFADDVIAKVDSPKPEDKVDLTQTFTVVLDGTLTKEGKFDTKKTRFVKGEGNEQMVNVAKKAIEAIGDSTLFSYLQALGVDKVNITLVQDDKQISALIKSSQPNEEKARTISSGFNGLIAIANMNTKDDAEVQSLIKATKFSAEGKSFLINFAMPKDQAHQLIDKKLQEARQKKPQTNSGDGIKESSTAKGL